MIINTLKRHRIATILVMMTILTAAFLFAFLSTEAFGLAQDKGFLEKGQTVNGIGLFANNLVQIDGTVEGTTFVSGQEVQINGVINGDLFVAAQNTRVNGKVDGNIYVAGQNLIIGTQSTGDVFLLGQKIEIAKEAALGRDLLAAGQNILLYGSVQRQFSAGGSDILIGGFIGQNANLEAANIKLLDDALINGELSYKSPNRVNLATGSKISGETNWQYIKPEAEQERRTPADFARSTILSIAGALLIWFLVAIWRPQFWTAITRSIAEQPLKTIGVGVIAFLLTPLLIILSMITVIGLPLGIILGLAYGVLLYLARIIAAVFAGSWLKERFGWTDRYKGFWPVLLSLTVLVLLFEVPILGIIVWLLVAFAGLGSAILSK